MFKTKSRIKNVKNTKEKQTRKSVGVKKIFEPPSHAQIERKAYDLYAQRGYSHGHDLDDWSDAERSLKGV